MYAVFYLTKGLMLRKYANRAHVVSYVLITGRIRSYRSKFKEWGILRSIDTLGPSVQRGHSHTGGDQVAGQMIHASASSSNTGPATSSCTCQQRHEQQVSTFGFLESAMRDRAVSLTVPDLHHAGAGHYQLPNSTSEGSQAWRISIDAPSLVHLIGSICASQADVKAVESTLAARLTGCNTSLKGDVDATAAARLALQGGQYDCLDILLKAGATLNTEDVEDAEDLEDMWGSDTLKALRHAFACEAGAVVYRPLFNLMLDLGWSEPVWMACEGVAQNPTAIPLVEGVVEGLLREVQRNYYEEAEDFEKVLTGLIFWLLRMDKLANPTQIICDETQKCFVLACTLIGGLSERLNPWPNDQMRICPPHDEGNCKTGMEYLLYHLPSVGSVQRTVDKVEDLMISADRETIKSLARACIYPCYNSPCRASELLVIHGRCISQLDSFELHEHGKWELWNSGIPHDPDWNQHSQRCSEQLLLTLFQRDSQEQRVFFDSPRSGEHLSGRVLLFMQLIWYWHDYRDDLMSVWPLIEMLLGQYYRIHGPEKDILIHSTSNWRLYLQKEYLRALLSIVIVQRPDSPGRPTGGPEEDFYDSLDYATRVIFRKKDTVHGLVVQVITKLAFEHLLDPTSSMASGMTCLQRFRELHDILKARKSFSLPDITINNSKYSDFTTALLEEMPENGCDAPMAIWAT